MRVETASKDGISYLQFDPNNGKTSVRIEWPSDQKVQLFDQEISRVMINFGWATQPGPDEIEWLRALLDGMTNTSTQVVPEGAGGALLNTQIAGDDTKTIQTGDDDSAKEAADVAGKEKAVADAAAAEALAAAEKEKEKAKVDAAAAAAKDADANKK